MLLHQQQPSYGHLQPRRSHPAVGAGLHNKLQGSRIKKATTKNPRRYWKYTISSRTFLVAWTVLGVMPMPIDELIFILEPFPLHNGLPQEDGW